MDAVAACATSLRSPHFSRRLGGFDVFRNTVGNRVAKLPGEAKESTQCLFMFTAEVIGVPICETVVDTGESRSEYE